MPTGPEDGPRPPSGGGASPDGAAEPALDPARVRRFTQAWAEQEHWFQSGMPGAQGYAWPVPGSRQVAGEGLDAFGAYRDYLFGFVTAVSGFREVHEDVRRLMAAVRARHPGEPARLLRSVTTRDPTFRAQWNNLFAGGPYWAGDLSHESLGAYVRKYEVEWPIRVLACLRELLDRGRYDVGLRRFRDAQQRLKKGVVIDYLFGGFARYPHLRAALRSAYAPKLRNLIGHNEYVIDGGTVRAADGAVVETADGVWARMRALGAIQDCLVWVDATGRHDARTLAPRGVLGLVWVAPEGDGLPRLRVLQVAAFRQYDPPAAWLTAAVIERRGDRIDTTLGAARTHGGPVTEELTPVLREVVTRGRLACDVVGVVPCLHVDEAPHEAYELPAGRFCAFDDCVARVVPAVLTAAE